MKKLLVALLMLSILFAGCSNKPSEPLNIEVQQIEDGELIRFNRLPHPSDDLSPYLSDPFVSAAIGIASMGVYEDDDDDCFDLLEFMNGPDDLSTNDKNFIVEQFGQYPYVVRSYFLGASPENDYKTDELAIKVMTNPYTYDEDGYCKFYVQSSGADSLRPITVRYKPSEDSYYLFNYLGLLAGIRIPKSQDKWS